ncbi:1722_t:CDS:2 [Paraglomus brasilianum]|uniref:Alkyl transferase n=1 Tax=Paraglomus brasilianum TaxID=144538 RepID=A0A9N9G6N4_9GLOM|nr:1722_t:CDS:2 [Paraglomus brasilianum]
MTITFESHTSEPKRPTSFPQISLLFTSPISYFTSVLRYLLIQILKQGPVPQHVGFVMDGNRRFAKKINVQTGEGHYLGFKKLEETLDICLQLGIKVVTVYAFSIENFKRPKEEVQALMELGKAKLIELCEHSDVVRKFGVRVRVIGNESLLSSDLRDIINKTKETTKDNYEAILNICCPYTSRDEIASSIRGVVNKAQQGEIQISDITENILEDNLYTSECPPLEILIRTSGEIRLSDFLLWQSHQNCSIRFVDCYWPEFSIWDMLPIFLEYQQNRQRK